MSYARRTSFHGVPIIEQFQLPNRKVFIPDVSNSPDRLDPIDLKNNKNQKKKLKKIIESNVIKDIVARVEHLYGK